MLRCLTGVEVSVSTSSIRHGHPCSVNYPADMDHTRRTALTTRSELINIFEIFLPQLLRYPNPADPLNGEAAALLMRDPKAYAKKVESYVDRFATPEDADQAGDDDDEDEDQPMGNSVGRPKVVGMAVNGNGSANGKGPTNGNGNGHTNGHSNGKGDTNGADGEEEEDEEDKMSDMGELSDGDDFMGEMDD